MSDSNYINNNSPFPFLSEENDRSVIVFVIGPYARKWFLHTQYAFDPAENKKIHWIMAPDADDLHQQRQRLHLPNSNTITMAFFPFLPDGQENSQLTLKQITDWQAAFSARPWPESLRCVFGLYAQLSNERSVEDPDKAIWLGRFDVTANKETTLNHEFALQYTILKQQARHCRCHDLQRFAMVDSVRRWMHDTKVITSLQTLFTSASLKLTGMLLSDYGEGFVRHGAWANWIASRYQIFPGLASTIILPQLPELMYSPQIQTASAITEKPQRKVNWFIFIAALTLALLLTRTTLQERQRLLTARNSLEIFNQLDDAQIQKKHEIYTHLMKYLDDSSNCSVNPVIHFLKLSRCKHIRDNIKESVRHYQRSLLFHSGSVNLFSSDSSELGENSDKILRTLLPIIINNPETTFIITGHTDNSGTYEMNMNLSKKRALVVRDWLVKNTDIPSTRFIVRGVGDASPIASDETEEGRRLNRRVNIMPVLVNQHTNHE